MNEKELKLVEKLKKDKQYPFFLLSSREREILENVVGRKNCLMYVLGSWKDFGTSGFTPDYAYRIKSDWQPEEEPEAPELLETPIEVDCRGRCYAVTKENRVLVHNNSFGKIDYLNGAMYRLIGTKFEGTHDVYHQFTGFLSQEHEGILDRLIGNQKFVYASKAVFEKVRPGKEEVCDSDG